MSAQPTPPDFPALLASLPPDSRVTADHCRVFDRALRDGEQLNTLQRQITETIVKLLLEKGVDPPAPLESLVADRFLAMRETHAILKADPARNGEAEKARSEFAEFVKAVQRVPALAARAQAAAKEILDVRAQKLAKLQGKADVVRAEEEETAEAPKERLTANAYIMRARNTQKGQGDETIANPERAIEHLEDGVAAHPNNPELLALAAGANRAHAARTRDMIEREIHLGRAQTYAQRCYTLLSEPPHARAPGADARRKQLRNLLMRIERDLAEIAKRAK